MPKIQAEKMLRNNVSLPNYPENILPYYLIIQTKIVGDSNGTNAQ